MDTICPPPIPCGLYETSTAHAQSRAITAGRAATGSPLNSPLLDVAGGQITNHRRLIGDRSSGLFRTNSLKHGTDTR